MVFIQEIIYLKEKDVAYVINLDEYESIGNHWIHSSKNITKIFIEYQQMIQ